MDETQIYNQALEDITKRMITYYGNIGTTSGASVQYYVMQIKKDLTNGDQQICPKDLKTATLNVLST
jgi:hypothetical protein